MSAFGLYQKAQLEKSAAFCDRVGMAVTVTLLAVYAEAPLDPARVAVAQAIIDSSAKFVADTISALAAMAAVEDPPDEWILERVAALFDQYVAAQG